MKKTAIVEHVDSAILQNNIVQPLALRSMFWRPELLAKSAWLEHIPFAFWLVEALRPKVLVELGTHFGTSYFAFCQAVDRLELRTQCYAVDSWKGDAHTGLYDEKIFTQVQLYNQEKYSGFSRLIRSTFDEAVTYFEDGTVDLLHIDGLHTLDAVRHDFQTWLPKLSESAIVLLHDTNVRERGFGVSKLFDELRQHYPTFHFLHGHGLGVVGVGRSNALMSHLFQAADNPGQERQIQDVFARLGKACADTYQVNSYRDAATKFQEEANSLKRANEELGNKFEKTRSELTAKHKDFNDLKSKFDIQTAAHSNERGRLEERAHLIQELRAEASSEIKLLRGTLENITKELISREAEVSHLRATEQAQLHAFQNDRAELLSRISALQLENSDLHARLHDIETQAQQSSDAHVAKCEAYEDRVSNLTTELTEVQRALDSALKQVSQGVEERAILRDQSNSLKAELEASLRDVAAGKDLSEQLSAELRQRDERIDCLASQAAVQFIDKELLDHAQQAVERLQVENSGLQKNVEQRFEELAQLTSMMSEAATTNKAEREINADLRKQLEQLKKANTELTRLLSKQTSLREDSEHKLRASAEQFERERSNAEQLVSELTSAKSELTRLHGTIAQLNEENTKLKSNVSERFDEIARLSALLGTADCRISELTQLARKSATTESNQSDAPVQSHKPRTDPQDLLNRPSREILSESPLFDSDWYRQCYYTGRKLTIEPVEHYLRFGAKAGHDPSPNFSTEQYLSNYPDVAEAGLNPLLHYIIFGINEGRRAHPSVARNKK